MVLHFNCDFNSEYMLVFDNPLFWYYIWGFMIYHVGMYGILNVLYDLTPQRMVFLFCFCLFQIMQLTC
jgi:hypothetical protein